MCEIYLNTNALFKKFNFYKKLGLCGWSSSAVQIRLFFICHYIYFKLLEAKYDLLR